MRARFERERRLLDTYTPTLTCVKVGERRKRKRPRSLQNANQHKRIYSTRKHTNTHTYSNLNSKPRMVKAEHDNVSIERDTRRKAYKETRIKSIKRRKHTERAISYCVSLRYSFPLHVCMSVHLPVCLSLCPCISLHPSLCVTLSVFLFCLSVCLHVSLRVPNSTRHTQTHVKACGTHTQHSGLQDNYLAACEPETVGRSETFRRLEEQGTGARQSSLFSRCSRFCLLSYCVSG